MTESVAGLPGNALDRCHSVEATPYGFRALLSPQGVIKVINKKFVLIHCQNDSNSA